MNRIFYFFGLTILSLILSVSSVFSQTEQTNTTNSAELKKDAPTIFIDCETSDLEFIQEQIKFVNYAKNQNEAQIYIRITSQKKENESMEYTLFFKGQDKFDGDDDHLIFQPDKPDNEEEVKKELANTLKMGLMRYVGKTPISSQISINLMDEVKPTDVKDKWDFWVFSLGGDTFFDGEKFFKSSMYSGSFSANRVTPKLKIRMSVNGSSDNSKFTFEDEVIDSSSNSLSFSGLIVKSLNDHWSVGAYFSANSSTYSNTKLNLTPAPAIEFSLFPYSQFTKRQLRLLYRLGFTSIKYREETIYEKTYENLWRESLTMSFELKQKWGTMSVSLEGSHYFHDFSKYRLVLHGDLSLRLIRGLNFNISGSYSRIHDQLSLSRGGASLDDILLRRSELATTYTYYMSVGLSITFGSTRSNVVNPRFGSGGSSISISF